MFIKTKNIKTFLLICLFLSLGACSSGAVQARPEKEIGPSVRIIKTTGEVNVRVSRETSWKEARKRMTLRPGDHVKTSKNSSCDLAFDLREKNVVSIRPDTHVVLKLAKKEKIELVDGTLFSVIENLPEGSEFEVRTPLAICGVRGTKFKVSSDNKMQVTKLSVARNSVKIQSSSEPAKSAVVAEDQMREISPWDKALLRAKGEGIHPVKSRKGITGKAVTETEYIRSFGAEALIAAKRAAVVDAHRKLAEKIYGVVIEEGQTLEDYAMKDNAVKKTVSGIVKGARLVKTGYNGDGSVNVTVETEGERVKKDLEPLTGDIFGKDCLTGAVRVKRSDFEEFLL